MFFNYCDPRISLRRTRLFGVVFSASLLIMALFATPTILRGQSGVNDGHGKVWMQLRPTMGLSWNATAQACPQDGVTPCVGLAAGRSVGDWVWATDAQVLQLFSYYEPAMATNRSVSGFQYFFTGQTFLSAFQPTFSSCQTYSCGAYGAGWTASKDDTGLPIFGSVSWGNTPVSISGSFGVGPPVSADEAQNERGVWLWRATGPGVFAYDDAGYTTSPNGGVAVANVLANDWIAAAPATTANVMMSQVSSTSAGVSLNVVSGSVNVAAITYAGTYSLVYRICDMANASNCDDATVTVVVNPYVVDAVNDSGWASPSTGGTAVASVLANDTLSGARATLTNVSLSSVSVTPANAGVTLNLADGSVNVAAGTTFGTYAVVYQICDNTNLANCDQATATIVVRNYVIDAVDDYVRASSKTTGIVIPSVLANDTFNGARAMTTLVQISLVSPPIAGITLNTSTGAVSVAAKTSSGISSFVYRICEIASPTNCDNATVTVELSGRGR